MRSVAIALKSAGSKRTLSTRPTVTPAKCTLLPECNPPALAKRVKPGGRLVEKDEFRTGDDRAGKGEPFLHAAGELAGIVVAMIINFQLPQGFVAAFANFIVCQACRLFERERHIFQSRQ